MLARYAPQSITRTLMALRFTRRISAIFSHPLQVSGIQCNKPTLPSPCPQTYRHTVLVHSLQRRYLLACMNCTRRYGGGTRAHACTFKHALVCGHKWGHLLAACGAVSIFDSESIIFNLSEGICVMKADANSNKRKKTTQQQ